MESGSHCESKFIEKILKSHPNKFGGLLENAKIFKFQLLVTEVERPPNELPRLKRHCFRTDEEYFYPASSIKICAVLSALQKLSIYEENFGVNADELLRSPLHFLPSLNQNKTNMDNDTEIIKEKENNKNKTVKEKEKEKEKEIEKEREKENNENKTVKEEEKNNENEVEEKYDESNVDGGLINLDHEIRKLFLVSDNIAFNRLYSFVGHKFLNEYMWHLGLTSVRIRNRIDSLTSSDACHRLSPPVQFHSQPWMTLLPKFSTLVFPEDDVNRRKKKERMKRKAEEERKKNVEKVRDDDKDEDEDKHMNDVDLFEFDEYYDHKQHKEDGDEDEDEDGVDNDDEFNAFSNSSGNVNENIINNHVHNDLSNIHDEDGVDNDDEFNAFSNSSGNVNENIINNHVHNDLSNIHDDDDDDRDYMIGSSYIDMDGKKVEKGLDFKQKNKISLLDLQNILIKIFSGDINLNAPKLELAKNFRKKLLNAMCQYPSESKNPKYDPKHYPDNYCKFFLDGLCRVVPKKNLKIFNKIGQAYGFTIDNSYVQDAANDRELYISMVVYTNANNVLNDDKYEYDLAFRFFNDVGEVMARAFWKLPSFSISIRSFLNLFKPNKAEEGSNECEVECGEKEEKDCNTVMERKALQRNGCIQRVSSSLVSNAYIIQSLHLKDSCRGRDYVREFVALHTAHKLYIDG